MLGISEYNNFFSDFPVNDKYQNFEHYNTGVRKLCFRELNFIEFNHFDGLLLKKKGNSLKIL